MTDRGWLQSAVLSLALLMAAHGSVLARPVLSPTPSQIANADDDSECDADKRAAAEHLGVPCYTLTKRTTTETVPPRVFQNQVVGAKSGEARIIIIRDYAEPIIYASTVYIDDQKAVTLWQHDFSELRIPAGPHQLSVRWFFMAKQPAFDRDVILAPDRTYYFKIDAQSRVKGAYVYMTNGVRQLPESEASALIQNCCKKKNAEAWVASN